MKQSRNRSCSFCNLPDKYILFEENFMFLTIAQDAHIDGQLMIVPHRHVNTPQELNDAEWDTVRRMQYIAKRLFKEVHGISGMQLIHEDNDGHVHFNLVPIDKPDLVVWNDRKLEHTAGENAGTYRKQAQMIAAANAEYADKYTGTATLPIVADAIITNTRGEILVQERIPEKKLNPDIHTIPGGGLENLSVPLEEDLVREVMDECGIRLEARHFKLVASRLGSLEYVHPSKYLGIDCPSIYRFIWNTYVYTVPIDPGTSMKPMSDAKILFWLPLEKVPGYPHFTPEIKEVIAESQSRITR